ncbi:zwei Ig domain protein zig-8 isoform X2 [Biomphalaria pfeifferi]|uniref:Zwei Ig domain protein zig-8 isoform X2 n=1 Tax=Biomphalaria pfeifferi TaxID=112525 RepID=A0AAD8CCY9_BIOPF|nr:zwei Ig domain protein zig-8 isoform X2 [Biomphalaria pfeifferi]
MAGRDADKEVRVIAGSKFCLRCNLSLTNQSATSSTLDWYKDGEMLQYNNRILLTRYQLATDLMSVSEVHIDNSHLIDSGSYHCRWKSKDIYVYQVNVLPDINITGTNEDHFEFFAVDKIGEENTAAASTTRLSEFLFHFSLLFVISQFVQTFSSFLQSTEQGHSSDPT